MKATYKVGLGVLLVAVLGTGLLAYGTSQGVGIGGDATIYITSARNLLRGSGLGLVGPQGEFRLLPYFPPFYPLILSLFGIMRLDIPAAAQGLNLTLFAAIIVLVGVFTFRQTGIAWAALLAAGMTALSPVLLPTYSWAMSEPLAILLGFAGLAVLQNYLSGGQRRTLLLASAVLAGLSTLTRYSSAAYIATGFLALLIFERTSLRKRLAHALLYGLIALLPLVFWLQIDYLLTATVASRSVESVTGMLDRFYRLWPALSEVVLFWFLPESWVSSPPYPRFLHGLLILAIIALLPAYLFYLSRVKGERQAETSPTTDLDRLIYLLAGFLGIYFLLIGLVYISTYPPITIGYRMLSPAHIAFFWLLALLGARAVQLQRARLLGFATCMGLTLVCLWFGWRTVRIVEQNHELGLGFHSKAWQSSEVVEAVRGLPDGQWIISNEDNAILFLTGRPAYPLAEIYLQQPQHEALRYGGVYNPADLPENLFGKGEAVLVVFDTLPNQLAPIYGDRADERAESLVEGLDILFAGADGVVYRYPGTD